MNVDKLSSVICRVFFFASFLLLGLAVLDRLFNWFGYTILAGSYSPGRMLQFAGTFLIFVIALLLREVREEIRRGRA